MLPWHVVHTKPRQEKALARDLLEREIPYFLPMILRETSSGGRRRRNLYPLFASYVFFAGDEAARLKCLRTNRVVQIIATTLEQRARLTKELQNLAVALLAAPDKVQYQSLLEPGASVWIRSGPMRGLEGTVTGIGNLRKLQLAVSLLGVGATVEIHPDLVEKK